MERESCDDIREIFAVIDELDRKIARTPTSPPKGEKTKEAIAQIDEILKTRGHGGSGSPFL